MSQTQGKRQTQRRHLFNLLEQKRKTRKKAELRVKQLLMFHSRNSCGVCLSLSISERLSSNKVIADEV